MASETPGYIITRSNTIVPLRAYKIKAITSFNQGFLKLIIQTTK